jgi:hypothetical protein
MKRLMLVMLTLLLAVASCGGATTAGSCAEYAEEVEALLDGGAEAEEIQAFIDDTNEHVAELIMDDPDHAQACADAVFTAIFTAGFAGLEEEWQAEFGD